MEQDPFTRLIPSLWGARMTPSEYVDKVNEFSSYKRYDFPVYPIFLLIEELHELKEHIENCSDADKLIFELGDILWATAAIAIETNQRSFLQNSTYWYNRTGVGKANIYKKLLETMESVEKFAGRIHKFLRSDPDAVPEWRNLVQTAHLFLLVASDSLGVPLACVAEKNVQKLTDRRRRLTLHGDGDNR